MRFLGRLPSFSNKKVIPVSLRKSTSSIDTGVTIQTSQRAKSLSYSFSSVEDEVSYCEFSVKEETHALSFWEPVCLLGQGSISDIHLVKRRKRKNFAKVKLGSDNDITNGCRRTKSWSRKSNDDTKSKDLYVLKSIAKGHLGDEDVLAEMRLEIDTMSKLSHPNICSVVEAYSLRDQSYLVMEFCSGGNLADRIPMSESQATRVIISLVQAVDYLHESGICHRDIKLENVMFTDAGELKLIDFGLACKFTDTEGAIRTLTEKVGTLYSMSPQCLAESYDHRCDIWSIGVVAYLLLSGKQPFWGNEKTMPWQERRLEMTSLIEKCEFSPMNGAAWYNISSSAKAFVRSLLQLEAEERPTPKEALQSEWIQTCT